MYCSSLVKLAVQSALGRAQFDQDLVSLDPISHAVELDHLWVHRSVDAARDQPIRSAWPARGELPEGHCYGAGSLTTRWLQGH